MILQNKKVMHISGMTIPPYGLHYIPRGNIGLVGISGKAKILKMVGTETETEAKLKLKLKAKAEPDSAT